MPTKAELQAQLSDALEALDHAENMLWTAMAFCGVMIDRSFGHLEVTKAEFAEVDLSSIESFWDEENEVFVFKFKEDAVDS